MLFVGGIDFLGAFPYDVLEVSGSDPSRVERFNACLVVLLSPHPAQRTNWVQSLETKPPQCLVNHTRPFCIPTHNFHGVHIIITSIRVVQQQQQSRLMHPPLLLFYIY